MSNVFYKEDYDVSQWHEIPVPFENYPDRKWGSEIKFYSSSVEEQVIPY